MLRVVTDHTSRTRTAAVHQRYPQRMSTPLYCDPLFFNAAVVCVQSPSGGTFSDDDLTTTVLAEPHTHLRLTTQAATQVFAGPGPGACHRLDFRIGAGAVLEYLPKTLIPHTGSKYSQFIDIGLDATGCYLGWEALAAGRLGHGERFDFHSYDAAVRLNVDGRTVVRDRQRLEQSSAERLLGADYLATLLAVAPSADCAALVRRVRQVLADLPATTRAGAGELPDSAGIIVRVTTNSAPDLQRVQSLLLDEVRDELLIRSRSREEHTP
jgi:urease accessory protein